MLLGTLDSPSDPCALKRESVVAAAAATWPMFEGPLRCWIAATAAIEAPFGVSNAGLSPVRTLSPAGDDIGTGGSWLLVSDEFVA